MVSVQASVLSERRGDQPKQHKQAGRGEQKQRPTGPEPDQHTTADRATTQGKKKGGRDRRERGRARGRAGGGERDRERSGRRGGARKRGHEAAKGKRPTAAKRDNKQQHEQEEERKRRTAGPDHDTAQARLLVRTGQGHAISRAVPVRGHGEQVRGAGREQKSVAPRPPRKEAQRRRTEARAGRGREDQKTPRPQRR